MLFPCTKFEKKKMNELKQEINDLKSMVVAYGEMERPNVQYRDIANRFSKLDVDFETNSAIDSSLKADYQVRHDSTDSSFFFFFCIYVNSFASLVCV